MAREALCLKRIPPEPLSGSHLRDDLQQESGYPPKPAWMLQSLHNPKTLVGPHGPHLIPWRQSFGQFEGLRPTESEGLTNLIGVGWVLVPHSIPTEQCPRHSSSIGPHSSPPFPPMKNGRGESRKLSTGRPNLRPIRRICFFGRHPWPGPPDSPRDQNNAGSPGAQSHWCSRR